MNSPWSDQYFIFFFVGHFRHLRPIKEILTLFSPAYLNISSKRGWLGLMFQFFLEVIYLRLICHIQKDSRCLDAQNPPRKSDFRIFFGGFWTTSYFELFFVQLKLKCFENHINVLRKKNKYTQTKNLTWYDWRSTLEVLDSARRLPPFIQMWRWNIFVKCWTCELVRSPTLSRLDPFPSGFGPQSLMFLIH